MIPKPALSVAEGFSWEDFVERNNHVLSEAEGNERVATARLSSRRSLGPQSAANRMLSFAYKRFGGRVPEPGELDDACKFRGALNEALALAREANGYLDRKAPWFQIKEDRQAAATSVYVILRVVDNRKTILAPIVPHTAQKLHEFLGYEGQLFGTQHLVKCQEEARLGGVRSHEALTCDHSGAIGTWAASQLPAGQALRKPAPLFKKLDESPIDEEYARLEG